MAYRRVRAAEWGNAAKKTTFELYGPFGRAQKITAPDNNISWMTYKGARQIKKEANLATSYAGEELVMTTETFDQARTLEQCRGRFRLHVRRAPRLKDLLYVRYRQSSEKGELRGRGDRQPAQCGGGFEWSRGDGLRVLQYRITRRKPRSTATGPEGYGAAGADGMTNRRAFIRPTGCG